MAPGRRVCAIAAALLLAVPGAARAGARCEGFGAPSAVPLRGYDGTAMEPFVTRDGRYLLFNDSNAPFRDTDLHYAERALGGFVYRGRLRGANSTDLDGVASVDETGNLYFISMRSYFGTFSTIYRGRFSHGEVDRVGLVEGVSRDLPDWVNFDAEISSDGETLVFVDGFFVIPSPFPYLADLVIARRQGSRFVRDRRSDEIMRNVNSPSLEYAPSLSRDGLELYFTRALTAPGTDPQIYRATRSARGEPFEPPVLLASLAGAVEAPALSPDGRTLYLHRKVGDGFRIYRAARCG